MTHIQPDINWRQNQDLFQAPITPQKHFRWTVLIRPEILLSVILSSCRRPSCCLSIPSSASLSCLLASIPTWLVSDLCLQLMSASLSLHLTDSSNLTDWDTHRCSWCLCMGKYTEGRPSKRLQIFTITWGALCVELVPLKCSVFILNFKKEARSTARWYSIFSQWHFSFDPFTEHFPLPICIIYFHCFCLYIVRHDSKEFIIDIVVW